MAVGRKPKPTELRILEGNREHRPLVEGPKPRPARLRASSWLSKEAQREWRRLVPELYRLGLLTAIDRAALEAYCICYMKWREAEDKAEIAVFKTDTGYVGMNPFIAIANKYLKELRALMNEFGMTPSSRARVRPIAADEEGDEDLD